MQRHTAVYFDAFTEFAMSREELSLVPDTMGNCMVRALEDNRAL